MKYDLPNCYIIVPILDQLISSRVAEMPIRINPYAEMHEKVEVFICGSGSAGLSAATWLSRYGVRCKIVDSRPGPLEVGQADGIQSRTTEIFESFGIVEDLLKQGYHTVETTFWSSAGQGRGIERTRCIPTSDPGLSHLHGVMLSQARLHGFLLKAMKDFNGQEVDYGFKVLEVKIDEEKSKDPESYPVTIVTEKDGKEKIFEAKYALVHLIFSLSSLSIFMEPSNNRL